MQNTDPIKITIVLSFLNQLLTDIDECAEGTDDCVTTCYNTVGSYKCGCQEGEELNDDETACIGKPEYYNDNVIDLLSSFLQILMSVLLIMVDVIMYVIIIRVVMSAHVYLDTHWIVITMAVQVLL